MFQRCLTVIWGTCSIPSQTVNHPPHANSQAAPCSKLSTVLDLWSVVMVCRANKNVQWNFHEWNSVPQILSLKTVLQKYKFLLCGKKQPKPFSASELKEIFICCTYNLHIYNCFTIFVQFPFSVCQERPPCYKYTQLPLLLANLCLQQGLISGTRLTKKWDIRFKAVKRGV